jgi:hypothetical protein
LLYRRLPALGVNIPESLREFWDFQFQGPKLSQKRFSDLLRHKGRLENAANRLKFAFLNESLDDHNLRNSIISELSRLLEAGGELFITGETPQRIIQPLLEAKGFTHHRQVRYASVVTRFDPVEIGHYHKSPNK